MYVPVCYWISVHRYIISSEFVIVEENVSGFIARSYIIDLIFLNGGICAF